MNGQEQRILAILTLKRHKDGVWIHRLVASLQQIVAATVQVQVVVLEDRLQGPFCVSRPIPRPWIGLVNRVSDASEPLEVKAAMALLQIAKQVWKIPIWNGPDSYSLCTHKWCHHVLFTQAGLNSPDTVASLQSQEQQSTETDVESKSTAILHAMKKTNDSRNEYATLDYLIKPNAGGFGAGIERRSAHTTVESEIQSDLPTYSDRMILFQSYMAPQDGKIYRVWFLNRKVQCAVERSVDIANNEPTKINSSEFTSGCVAGVCSLPKKKQEDLTKPVIKPWSVPDVVTKEIEQQLMPVLPDDCHCGSIEFLYTGVGQRLYFDLNLLSTLPVDGFASESDPWMGLATAIWDHMK